ncbi:DUF167 domain-containing protein [Geminisphaera colitermitum]|uniref:DUF167 domain-containing protein n=1 Tax=Geminisphaera colitermitum TaxID=1148786 RepID=UPI000196551B|nr:DUF167 domain-containing protein [Geminisphaera colitermitum]
MRQPPTTRSATTSAAVPATCILSIKAIPNASRNAIAGWLGDALKVKVSAPALEGRANEQLCDFLAETLGIPRRAVTVAGGEKSRQKRIQIIGLDLPAVRARLNATLGTPIS